MWHMRTKANGYFMKKGHWPAALFEQIRKWDLYNQICLPGPHYSLMAEIFQESKSLNDCSLTVALYFRLHNTKKMKGPNKRGIY